MNLGRSLLEITRALCVLGLIFLNFGHAPAGVVAGDVASVVADGSYCSTPADGDEHAPCHACRIGGGADLPVACGEALAPSPVALSFADAAEDFSLFLKHHGPAGPRAPPVA